MEALFDNRYRYDHIYPRGRSGETLRALDTAQQDHPVVIKRPAPQDAPPMRAAQEVGIQTEKRALEKVSGHPAVTELRGEGTFRAGGQTYHYIVVDRALGETVENRVLELAARHQTLPELEMLVIVDKLLDMLAYAHARQVIYNDIDTKHLFWDRDHYRLKVIDWGNAIFADESSAPPNITPMTDVYQVGELLYFLYHQGARLHSEQSPEGDYRVHFGADVPESIRQIITRATHPNTKGRRYSTIRTLREALTTYRLPLEQQRDQQLAAVKARLSDNANQQLLEALRGELEQVLAMDPGYPEARKLYDDVQHRLHLIELYADFEAAQIYLDTGNWDRAIRLMEELLPKADPYFQKMLRFLIAAAAHLQGEGYSALPVDFDQIITELLDAKVQQAALLLVADHQDGMAEERLLLAAQLITHLPGVTMLRPHLARIFATLGDDPHSRPLREALQQLNDPVAEGISPLADRYGKLAILLADYDSPALEAAAEQAQAAARDLLHHLRRVADIFYQQPETAQLALKQAQLIDPANPRISALSGYLDAARRAIEGLGSFQPTEDVQALVNWFNAAQEALQPYYRDLTDPDFLAISGTFRKALELWRAVGDYFTLGRQRAALETLHTLSQTMQPYNQQVAAWFQNTAQLLRQGSPPESFAPNESLSEHLVEGYNAWDRGQAGRAADFARRGLETARSDDEALAAERLQKLAEITHRWLNQGGLQDRQLTDENEHAALELLFPDERSLYDRFGQQMRSEETYLKAMRLGVVNQLKESSSAAYRALFVHYVLRGVLALQNGALEDADFWREAALQVNQTWHIHPLFTTFDTALARRKLVLRAEEALNAISDFEDLPAARQALNAPLAEAWLKEAQQALQQLDAVGGQWADGDFRAARSSLNTALDLLSTAEEKGDMNLEALRAWITPYRNRAGELIEQRQVVEQAAMEGSLEPNPEVLEALQNIVALSEEAMGTEQGRQVRLWLDLYKTMLATHSNQGLSKREKLAQFEINFAALFIEKHPAHRLYKRWQDAARLLPEDVQEDLQIELPQTQALPDTAQDAPSFEGDEVEPATSPPRSRRRRKTATTAPASAEASPAATTSPPQTPPPGIESVDSPQFDDYENLPNPYPEDERQQGRGWPLIIGVAALILLLMGAYALTQILAEEESGTRRFAATPTRDTSLVQSADASRTAQAALALLPTATDTPAPADSPTPAPPSATSTLVQSPSPTRRPSETPSPTVLLTLVTNTPPPPPTIASAPTLIDGESVDAFRVLNLIQPIDYDWDPVFFSQGAGGVWQLGASTEDAGSGPISITFSPEFLDAFSPDAATRLQSIEATMELVDYNEAELAEAQVFFGVGLQNIRRQRYTAQVSVETDGLVSLGVNANGRYTARTQIPVRRVEFTLFIERQDDGTVDFFIDGQKVGESPALFPMEEAVSLVLYHAGGGMFVNVSSLSLGLAPP